MDYVLVVCMPGIRLSPNRVLAAVTAKLSRAAVISHPLLTFGRFLQHRRSADFRQPQDNARARQDGSRPRFSCCPHQEPQIFF